MPLVPLCVLRKERPQEPLCREFSFFQIIIFIGNHYFICMMCVWAHVLHGSDVGESGEYSVDWLLFSCFCDHRGSDSGSGLVGQVFRLLSYFADPNFAFRLLLWGHFHFPGGSEILEGKVYRGSGLVLC